MYETLVVTQLKGQLRRPTLLDALHAVWAAWPHTETYHWNRARALCTTALQNTTGILCDVPYAVLACAAVHVAVHRSEATEPESGPSVLFPGMDSDLLEKTILAMSALQDN
jgi:hypothetical protein